MLDPESRMAAIPGSRKIPAVQQSTPMRTRQNDGLIFLTPAKMLENNILTLDP